MKKRSINQIFHPYWLWEDFKNGMYSENKEGREERIQEAIKMLSNKYLCMWWMGKVVHDWTYACEQKLTSPSTNKIAWLGQAACSYYAGVHEDETREAWSRLTDDIRNKANEIAEQTIETWMVKNYE